MNSDLTFALKDLAAWSRRHGIHQSRAALEFAAKTATDSPDSEGLAWRLEVVAQAAANVDGESLADFAKATGLDFVEGNVMRSHSDIPTTAKPQIEPKGQGKPKPSNP